MCIRDSSGASRAPTIAPMTTLARKMEPKWDPKMEPRRASDKWAQQKHENVRFTNYLLFFSHVKRSKKKHLFGSVLITWFGVECRSWKSFFENTSLQAPLPTWKPPVWFLDSEWGPYLELKSSKMEAWNALVNLGDPKVVPRWPQAPKLTQNSSQTHSKCVQQSMLLG